jgi:hypothetical protein
MLYWQPAVFPSATLAIESGGTLNAKSQKEKEAAWWRDIAKERLRELGRLSVGWDGHGGSPVRGAVASFALAVLTAIMRPGIPRPSIMPLSDGGVQIEWHCRGWDIEVSITDAVYYQAWAREIETGAEEETPVTRDLSFLGLYLSRIADP